MADTQVLGPGSLGAMDVYTKKVRTADQAGAEAAGLRWLAEARPDVVVEATGVSATSISTRRVVQATPTAEAARAFGRALREVHEAGAPAFGAPPAGWEGKNYIGRIEQDCTPTSEWGEFYVEQRVLPFVEEGVDGGVGKRGVHGRALRVSDAVHRPREGQELWIGQKPRRGARQDESIAHRLEEQHECCKEEPA